MKTLLIVLFLIASLFAAKNADAQKKSVPDTVKVGVYIIGISDIDFRQKQYMVRLWIWMKYKDKKYDFSENIEVTNCKTLEKLANIVDTSGEEAYTLMELKCIMKQPWMVQDYPFDEQQLEMHIENTQFDSREFIFASDNSGKSFDPKLTVPGWEIDQSKIYSSIHPYETSFGDASLDRSHSEYAAFNIELHIRRNAWALFFKLFLGMYVAFFITWVGIFIHINSIEWRFQLSVGGLFAAVGNKYIIDSLLPETSMFTLVDTLHAFTFFSILGTIALSVMSLHHLKNDNLEHSNKIDKWTAIIMLIVYLSLNVFFVWRAMYN